MPYAYEDSSYRVEDTTIHLDECYDDRTHVSSSSIFETSSAGTIPSERDHVDPVVAEKEQHAVFASRLVVLLVIGIALTSLSLTMYLLISKDEEDEFETQFLNFASEMSTVARQNAQTTIDTVRAFSTAVTSHAEATGSEWPFVSLLHFTSRALEMAKLNDLRGVAFAPIVYPKDLEGWVNYSMSTLPMVYQESIEYEGLNMTVPSVMAMTYPTVFKVDWSDFALSPEDRPGPWLVGWQTLPLMWNGGPLTNYNILNGPRPNSTFYSAYTTGLPALDFLRVPLNDGTDRWVPESQIMQPVYSEVLKPGMSVENQQIVAMIWLRLNWATYFENLLPVEVNGIILVLESTCVKENDFGASVYTYEVNGLNAIPIGEGDQHDPKYDELGVTAEFVTLEYNRSAVPPEQCISEMIMKIYPSEKFEESFYTDDARNYSLGVVFIFAFTTLVFGIYDFSVRRRQHKVMARIIRQDRIVSDVFPAAIRDKLYNAPRGGGKRANKMDMEDDDLLDGGPLAELYPKVTVIFVQIVGFTAWSSAREPSQVFELLECLYTEFDKVAYRHGVFKVETVGDCYVAAGGLPEFRPDHAVVVAKFARACLYKMKGITRVLEMKLGPDTADLDLRLGIHTGQVTAGVLRGERSRYQLFGDTVNTASRMEATSLRRQIQISASTAAELRKAGFSRWVRRRESDVAAKGKGDMQTYWLRPKGKSSRVKNPVQERLPLVEEEDDDDDDSSTDERLQKMTKTDRLVEWHVEVLGNLLRQMMTSRLIYPNSSSLNAARSLSHVEGQFINAAGGSHSTVLDEFKEIITLPTVDDDERLKDSKEKDPVQLSHTVVSELRSFLIVVSSLYRPNPFHNFEHASHVTSSVRKLLTRIVSAGQSSAGQHPESGKVQLVDRAGRSFGITSDPLTQFAVLFSAIIHDADHPGVPNAQLVKENSDQAILYKKSIAEQNSVDLVWDLLMRPEYSQLRACIYTNEDELRRFRQLVVNIVLATDIVDKELQNLRKARWEKAFSETPIDSTHVVDMNRKATIVLEHLIQASDVAHTMQHWHIYKRWNERFFMECYGAYKAGRAAGDPSVGWYKGEIGFFDFYVIPLAKKLDSCGVFGVSSDEYLNYAKSNRDEWVREGENLVKEYLEKFETRGDDSSSTDPLSDSSKISASSQLSV